MQAREISPTPLSCEIARSSKNPENSIIAPKEILATPSRERLSAALLVLIISFLSMNLLACGGSLVGNLSKASTSSGTGITPMKSLFCERGSITGSGTNGCTVTLSAAAESGGQAVSLTSDNAAVTVPSSVTVASGATSASFTAKISAVSTTQTATLTASAGGASSKQTIQLNAISNTMEAALAIQSTNVNFGTVALNTPSYQTDTLTSSGTAAVTISAATVTGTGFSISGLSFPLTLTPGETAQLQIKFDPTGAGAASGKVTLTSDCSSGATSTISLSGTGQSATQAASYEVNLSWDAPLSSPVGIVGYNVYRATNAASYKLINSSVEPSTTYTDSTVASNTSYNYYVESVDAEGEQSIPSNSYSVSIP